MFAMLILLTCGAHECASQFTASQVKRSPDLFRLNLSCGIQKANLANLFMRFALEHKNLKIAEQKNSKLPWKLVNEMKCVFD